MSSRSAFPVVERCVLQTFRAEDYATLSKEVRHRIKDVIIEKHTTLELGQVLDASSDVPSLTVVDLSPTTAVCTSQTKAATFIILPPPGVSQNAPIMEESRRTAHTANGVGVRPEVEGTQDIEHHVVITCSLAAAAHDCAVASDAFMQQLFLTDYSLVELGSEEYLTRFLVKQCHESSETNAEVLHSKNARFKGIMHLSVPPSLFVNLRAAYCASEVCANDYYDFSSALLKIPLDCFTPAQDLYGNLVCLGPHERHKETVLSAVKLVSVYSEFLLRHLFGDSFFDFLALGLQVGTSQLHGKLVSVGDTVLIQLEKSSLQGPTTTMSDAVDRFECVMRVYLHQQDEYSRLWGSSTGRTTVLLPFRVAEVVLNGNVSAASVSVGGSSAVGPLPYGFLYSSEEDSLGPTEVHLIPASASCLTLLDQTPVWYPREQSLLAQLTFCKTWTAAVQQCFIDSLGAKEGNLRANMANLLFAHGSKENVAFGLVEEVLSWFGVPVITTSASTVDGEEVELILTKLFQEATPTALVVRHADQVLARVPHFFSLLESAHRGGSDDAGQDSGSAVGCTHLICFVCESVEEPSPLLTAHSKYPVVSCGNPDQGDRAVFAKFTVLDLCETYPIVPSRFVDYDVMGSWMVGLSYSDIRNILHASVHKLLARYKEDGERTPLSCRYVLTMEGCQEELNAYIKSHGYSVVSTKLQPVRWSDVGGLEDAKRELKEAIQLPTLYPELFARSGMKKRSGILFYGPPGCGKTLLAKAVATEMNMNFMSVKGPELINQYVGESEKQIRQLFQKARDNAPCIIFFDELDALAPARGAKGDGGGAMDRIVAQLLVEVDGVGQQPAANGGGTTTTSPTIFIIGATNRPDLLDSALLRPGRFDRLCYLGIPATNEEQLYAVKALTRKFSLGKDVNLDAIVEQMDFVYTGADFFALCSDAMMLAVEEKLDEAKAGLDGAVAATLPARSSGDEDEKDTFTVSMKHFLKSLSQLKPSVSPDDLKRYELLRKKFSS